MIRAALKRALLFLGDLRLQLLMAGALILVCILDIMRGHWWHLALSVCIVIWVIRGCWSALGVNQQACTKTAADLAGHSPIGAHVDEAKPRRWRK